MKSPLSKKISSKTLEEEILILQQQARIGPTSIADILQLLAGKGRALLLIFLSLPFCLPIQIPGLSTPFGLAITFLGARQAFSQNVWLPQKILMWRIDSDDLLKITEKALIAIRKIQPWIYPRLFFLSRSVIMQTVNGLILSLLGLILALPLPIPLSNLTAAWAIFFLGLGILESDGLLIIFGYLIFAFTLLLFTFIFFFMHYIQANI